MALQTHKVRREQDPVSATALVVTHPVEDWRRFPPDGVAADSVTPEHQPVISYAGGALGDDVSAATANTTGPDYSPKTQAEKAAALGVELAVDVGRPRGWIEPSQPYEAPPASPADDPVVTSISPTTAPAASLPLMVTITGTGFSVWSTVYTGGAPLPDGSATFVDETTMQVPIWAASAGTVSVAVMDHGVLSNTDVLFTVT